MTYLIGGLVCLFVIYKLMVYFGRNNAVDVLCHNYQLDPKKVRALKDVDITRLTISLESYKSRLMRGNLSKQEVEDFTKLLEQFR
jgi:hypothetical protein